MPLGQEQKEVIDNRSLTRLPDGQVVDRDREMFVPREIKTWLQKVEEAQTTTVKDDKGNLVLTPTNPSVGGQAKPTGLPITQTTFIHNLKKKVSEAGRWLATFVLRLIKMKKGNVQFKEE